MGEEIPRDRGTVVSLVEPEINHSLVAMMEQLLEMAKDGTIVSFAGVAMSGSNGEFAEFNTDNAFDNAISYIAYLRVLQMKFEREIPFD